MEAAVGFGVNAGRCALVFGSRSGNTGRPSKPSFDGSELEKSAETPMAIYPSVAGVSGASVQHWPSRVTMSTSSAPVDNLSKGTPAAVVTSPVAPPPLSNTGQKLDALRKLMARQGLDAYWIPSADEHMNEYLPENKKRREWMTGFTGSAGDLLVTAKEAFLFVDSRYHEQVDNEVDLSRITPVKLGQPGAPYASEKLAELAKAQKGFRFGFHPYNVSVSFHRAISNKLTPLGAKPVAVRGQNLVDRVWAKANPPLPKNAPIFAVPDSVAGESSASKLTRIREEMKKSGVEALTLTKLDEIAWLANLRGSDIDYNPLFTSYAIVTPKDATLFVDEADKRLTAAVRKHLKTSFAIKPYGQYENSLVSAATGKTVALAYGDSTVGTLKAVEKAKGNPRDWNPVPLMKAIKNDAELAGMRQVHLYASAALVKTLKWLEEQVAAGNPVTEKSTAEALEKHYASIPGYKGLSFNTISGTGPNGSIVHYGTPSPTEKLTPGQLYLVDSGIQGLNETEGWAGTTDKTRTVLVGNTATPEQKHRYTAVLMAHIDAARQKFRKGMAGHQIDVITRAGMMNEGLDFGHGTGHGVGAFANVHEGPAGISGRSTTPFQPGMITSIEPGFYLAGWGGIRLENLYVVKEEAMKTLPDPVTMYGFEPLTFVPFDNRLIDTSMLGPQQLAWLHNYNHQVQDKLKPYLSKEEQAWLAKACKV